MDVMVREAGNSLVVTIPNDIIRSMNIKKGDAYSVDVITEGILLSPKTKKLRGEAYLEKYFGKPIGEIEPWDYEDVPTGEPVGDEVW